MILFSFLLKQYFCYFCIRFLKVSNMYISNLFTTNNPPVAAWGWTTQYTLSRYSITVEIMLYNLYFKVVQLFFISFYWLIKQLWNEKSQIHFDGSAWWNHVWYDVFTGEVSVPKRLQCRRIVLLASISGSVVIGTLYLFIA